MTDRFDAKAFLASVTERPGVYRFLNADGEILYVGKARNLKNRLSSYFRGTPAAIKTRRLVEQVADVEITTTQTEAEALLLESNLIKAHRPRYNVLLRDDKSYPWIYVSTNDRFPRLAYHRGSRKRPGRYFGPYPSAGAVRETLNLLEKVFKVRQCEDSVFKNRSRPCLQYQIDRCKAPCVDYVDEAEYRQDVEDTMAFLSGRSQKLIDDLVARMEKAAADLDFEKAAALRDQIGMLRAVSQQQGITGMSGDADVIALVSEQGISAVGVATIRDGRHLGTRHFFPDVPADADPAEVISGFLGLYYSDRDLPRRILCDHLPEDAEWLAGVFAEQAGHRVDLLVPRRGKARAWLEDTRENARIALNERLVSRRGLTRRFEVLGEWLAMDRIERIECFDISHTQGELTVASCVVFGPDGPRKDQYRRYHIEGIAPGDDYAAMRQALTRRFDRAVRESGVLPDVLLIDGGKGQLAQAVDVLAERELAGRVRVIGVAKGPERRPGEETLVQPLLGSPGLYTEDHLSPHDPALHLIQQVRDEAHRFAITGHRARRQKARTQSDLERIPGVGGKRRQALLKHFGGIRGLKGASVTELAKVPGISPTLAARIHEWFHEGGAG
ncbi:excinuclease ABC subunit UvrC [Guyparkeria halophila]|uniref:UvrABC system protein C n=1 Tax=Guyparkeria halophila TaxID=47960 RepID=A0A6I6D4L4_9GAMM|nr:excinuclease ABC subunit UvrC [Guyparkeria halophila]QGT79075.1 excinuclease ABC subunit UvrC [Guyparkeria halophila]